MSSYAEALREVCLSGCVCLGVWGGVCVCVCVCVRARSCVHVLAILTNMSCSETLREVCAYECVCVRVRVRVRVYVYVHTYDGVCAHYFPQVSVGLTIESCSNLKEADSVTNSIHLVLLLCAGLLVCWPDS